MNGTRQYFGDLVADALRRDYELRIGQVDLIVYLAQEIEDRLDAGQSMDCDAYRALLRIAGRNVD